ncbi:hypothetical protein ACP4OV_003132 [Aristida adscensionis]
MDSIPFWLRPTRPSGYTYGSESATFLSSFYYGVANGLDTADLDFHLSSTSRRKALMWRRTSCRTRRRASGTTAKKKAAAGPGRNKPDLPDDVLVEILARLPARSLRRCACVCRSWRAVIADPAHRARLAQTMAGLFAFSHPRGAASRPWWGFVGGQAPPGVDAALSFLPPGGDCGEVFRLLDACNGLLLLLCSRAPPEAPEPRPCFYVVCNPATGEWAALPPASHAPRQYKTKRRAPCAVLGFDPPAVSAGGAGAGGAAAVHFHVFQLVQAFSYQYGCLVGAVEIYSSETQRWVLSEARDFLYGASGPYDDSMAYFNGSLHLISRRRDDVVVVGANGEKRMSRVSTCNRRTDGFVGCSQGRLLCVDDDYHGGDVLSVYELDGGGRRRRWACKRRISKGRLLGESKSRVLGNASPSCKIEAFDPHRDVIFLYDLQEERFISYDMASRKARVIRLDENVERGDHLFLPYVPFYSRGLASAPPQA